MSAMVTAVLLTIIVACCAPLPVSQPIHLTVEQCRTVKGSDGVRALRQVLPGATDHDLSAAAQALADRWCAEHGGMDVGGPANSRDENDP